MAQHKKCGAQHGLKNDITCPIQSNNMHTEELMNHYKTHFTLMGFFANIKATFTERKTLIVAAALLFNASCNAGIKITVDPAYRHIVSTEILSLPPKENRFLEIHNNTFGDYYEIHYITNTPIQIFSVKQRDIESNNPNPNFLIQKTLKHKGFEQIKIPAIDQYAAVILRNENNFTANTHIRIDRVGTRPQEVRKNIEDIVNVSIDALSKIYNLPDIEITVKPCGQINAFSTPNIIICTELIGDLAEKKTIGALHPILIHELAHSLMYIWRIADHRDEDLADEFAMTLISMAAPNALTDLIEWFNKQDSKSEIILKNINNSRHSLSKQRAEVANRILVDPIELTKKWGKLLRPYEK